MSISKGEDKGEKHPLRSCNQKLDNSKKTLARRNKLDWRDLQLTAVHTEAVRWLLAWPAPPVARLWVESYSQLAS